MLPKNLPYILLLFACLAPATAPAADAGSRGQVMADAMLNMMEAMGRFSRDYVDSRGRSRDGFSQTWEAMSPNGGYSPWAGYPGEPAPALAPTRLEGDWLSPTGERLSIRGSRFRLGASPDRRLEGVLQIRGNLLALHSPKHRQTWIYEFAEQEGRLALRSTNGQLLLYRRVDPRDGRVPRRRR